MFLIYIWFKLTLHEPMCQMILHPLIFMVIKYVELKHYILENIEEYINLVK